MSLTSVPRLDGRVVATDLDRALQMLTEAEQLRSHAAVLLGGLDGAGLSRWLGYVSLERLVAHRTGCGNREARRLTKVARHLDQFEATAAALLAGRIGWAQAEVLARAANGFAKAYANDEAELIASAEFNEVERLEQICRLWRASADVEAAARDAEHRFNRRGVWLQFAFDGSCHGRLALDADGAEIVASAMETKPDPITPYGEARTAAQRRADALVEICQTEPCGSARSDGTEDGARPAGRAAVDVVIDVETLAGANGSIERIRAELAHGGPITGPGLDRLLCDASFRALVTDGPRTVLAYNRATPAIPPGLRRAVRIRDRQCTFHGCDRPWHWCDLHHIVPRNRGGPTTAENLTLLCRFHHTLTHDGGWQLSRAPNGKITVSRP